MELELKRESLNAYETGGELILTQEETAETIVPDYCPDIARIIATDGKIYLRSRELREGKAEVSGTIRITVLYTPEGESGIRTLEFALPFTVESDQRTLRECTYLTAETDAELLETRMLNPRKVFTSCKLITRITGYRKAPLCFSADLEAEESLCVEKQQERSQTILLKQIAEKDFTFTDNLSLSPGREGAEEILTGTVSPLIVETKLVGRKVIFKGTVLVSLLYRTHENRYCSVNAELPFSQIMEMEDGAEGASASVELQLTGTEFQISSDDPEGRQFAVTMYFRAVAILRQPQEVTLLKDLYSTLYETNYDTTPIALTDFWENFSRRQSVREILEIGVVAESILSAGVNCGSVSINREGDAIVLRTAATIQVIYLDEGGVPLLAERTVEVSCRLELPQDCKVTAKAVCTEEVQATLGDRGIEVRFPVDFHMEAVSSKKRLTIMSAKVETETQKNVSGTPSLVLRCLGRQESLWEMAKRNNTTIASILSANQLENEEELPREKFLLIPRKRA